MLLKKNKPKPWYLYHWNIEDGYRGLPKRKIHVKPFNPCLLRVAFLAGGLDWKEPETPQNSVLGLILNASPYTQSDQNYYTFFDHYNSEALSQHSMVSVERVVDFDRACWQVERTCLGMSPAAIDHTIETILTWHYREIHRISNEPTPDWP